MFSGTSNNNLYRKWSDLLMPLAKYKDYEYLKKRV